MHEPTAQRPARLAAGALVALAAPLLLAVPAAAVAEAGDPGPAAALDVATEGTEGTEATHPAGPVVTTTGLERSRTADAPTSASGPSAVTLASTIAAFALVGGAAGAAWDGRRRRHVARLPHKTVHPSRHRHAHA